MRVVVHYVLFCGVSIVLYSGYIIVVVFYVFYVIVLICVFFFFSSRRRHTRCLSDWSSDVCSSDLGNFVMTTRVRFHPVHQYDQAGLMVRVSPSCWLKTSVEYEPDGPSRLGAVVTNKGYSDWSTQDYTPTASEVWLRIRREGSDYHTLASADGRAWSQLRIARLLDDPGAVAVASGLYACAPRGKGSSRSLACCGWSGARRPPS